MVMRSRTPDGEARPDARQNQTRQCRERHARLRLKANRHQHIIPESPENRYRVPQNEVHPGNSCNRL